MSPGISLGISQGVFAQVFFKLDIRSLISLRILSYIVPGMLSGFSQGLLSHSFGDCSRYSVRFISGFFSGIPPVISVGLLQQIPPMIPSDIPLGISPWGFPETGLLQIMVMCGKIFFKGQEIVNIDIKCSVIHGFSLAKRFWTDRESAENRPELSEIPSDPLQRT